MLKKSGECKKNKRKKERFHQVIESEEEHNKKKTIIIESCLAKNHRHNTLNVFFLLVSHLSSKFISRFEEIVLK